MKEYKALIDKSSDFIKRIEKSLSSAVGDDIKIDIKVNELDTGNSTPSRIWDFINRNIGKNFSEENYITETTRRGRWEIKPIFEKDTGILYTLMREERLKELRKEVSKRTSAHYIQAITETLNNDLISPHEQLSLLENQNYYDQESISKIIHKIFSDLRIPDNIVKRHALILFSSSNHELLSLRCCLIKSDLNIVEQCDWSSYIIHNESSVSDLTIAPEPSYVTPPNSLKFKKKAKDKIRQENLSKTKDIKIDKDINNNE